MPKFKPYDYNQSSMVVINFEEQLQPGTFEHAIHHLVDSKLDLSIFDPHYRNDSSGCPDVPPYLSKRTHNHGVSTFAQKLSRCHSAALRAISLTLRR